MTRRPTDGDRLEQDWNDFEDREVLVVSCGGDPELARAAFVALGVDAVAWLDLPIPALAGRTPRSLLGATGGRRQVRAVLARMPR